MFFFLILIALWCRQYYSKDTDGKLMFHVAAVFFFKFYVPV